MAVYSTINAEIGTLDTGSTKRLNSFRSSLFNRSEDVKVPFDDRVKDVILDYTKNRRIYEDELAYLDSIKYGAQFVQGQIEMQLDRFRDDENGTGSQYLRPSFRWNRNYQDAKAEVAKLLETRFKLNVCEFKSDHDIAGAIPKLKAHAGFSYILTGLRRKGEYIEGSYDQFTIELRNAKQNGSFNKPILPGTRLQCSGAYSDGERTGTCKHKVRLVSMIDIYQVLAEMMFAIPFQSYLGKKDFYVGGKDDASICDIINYNRSKFPEWMTLDYSHYDQSIPSWLIEDAFKLIWDCCFSSGSRNYHWKWLWDVIVNDFITKKFVGPDGLISSNHGVPSGSMFTQIIDTIVNLLMINTYLLSKGNRTSDYFMIICGDDNLIFSKQKLDAQDISGYLLRNFGIECHPDKCSQGCRAESPEFLSRVWETLGAWRDPKELFAKMVYPEKFRDYHGNKQLSPELIVYSYILSYPLGMRELMDVERFKKDNELQLGSWSDAILDYQTGYLSYFVRYVKK